MGLGSAFKLFFAALGGAEFVDAKQAATDQEAAIGRAVAKAVAEMPKPEPIPDRFDEGAVYTLLLLQREGRLIDFLQEEIEGYGDADVGRAVRQIHSGCRKVLADQFGVAPVMKQPEGEGVTVPATFDPLELRLTGSVPDSGPYKGVLAHKGWRATVCKFAKRTGKVDPKVIYQAEIEVG